MHKVHQGAGNRKNRFLELWARTYVVGKVASGAARSGPCSSPRALPDVLRPCASCNSKHSFVASRNRPPGKDEAFLLEKSHFISKKFFIFYRKRVKKKKKKSGQAAQDQEAWGSVSQGSAGAGAQQKQLLTLAERGHLLLTSRASVSPSLEATPRRYSCVCSLRRGGALTFCDVQGLSGLLKLRPSAGREHSHECDQSKNRASCKWFPHPCTLLLFSLKTTNAWVCLGWPLSHTIRRQSPKTREQARAMVALG